jgi:DNA helicase-2/ATP-dependent DNA helicase PcrA
MAKKSAKSGKLRASPLKATSPRKKAETSRTEVAATVAQPSKYTVGDLISHSMFGDGVVTAIDANKLTIEFSNNIIKQIIDDYVKPRMP